MHPSRTLRCTGPYAMTYKAPPTAAMIRAAGTTNRAIEPKFRSGGSERAYEINSRVDGPTVISTIATCAGSSVKPRPSSATETMISTAGDHPARYLDVVLTRTRW